MVGAAGIETEGNMPRGDRTGPEGRGSMTGRGLGNCSGSGEPAYTSGNRGRGFRRGFGGGFGRGLGRFFGGRGFGRSYETGIETDVSEKTLIENEIRILKDKLGSLEKRLSDSKES